MKQIELQKDFSWYWLASIVDAAMDGAAKSAGASLRPLLDMYVTASPFTGKYSLLINQGGVQNRDIAKPAKELFKDEVLPYIKRKSGIGSSITGKLELHLAEGAIKKAIFYTA